MGVITIAGRSRCRRRRKVVSSSEIRDDQQNQTDNWEREKPQCPHFQHFPGKLRKEIWELRSERWDNWELRSENWENLRYLDWRVNWKGEDMLFIGEREQREETLRRQMWNFKKIESGFELWRPATPPMAIWLGYDTGLNAPMIF